jgi:hypothetical protein
MQSCCLLPHLKSLTVTDAPGLHALPALPTLTEQSRARSAHFSPHFAHACRSRSQSRTLPARSLRAAAAKAPGLPALKVCRELAYAPATVLPPRQLTESAMCNARPPSIARAEQVAEASYSSARARRDTIGHRESAPPCCPGQIQKGWSQHAISTGPARKQALQTTTYCISALRSCES